MFGEMGICSTCASELNESAAKSRKKLSILFTIVAVIVAYFVLSRWGAAGELPKIFNTVRLLAIKAEESLSKLF